MSVDPESSADFADHLDDALAALWAGQAEQMDELFEEKGTGGPGVAEILGAGSAGDREDASAVPQQIGPFEILRELGRGGMGIVYEARQRHPDRVVALKVIRGAYLDEHRVRMFEREVQTLARLKHPNIASLYEAGQTADGQHYFAMELISGVPLTDYGRSSKDLHTNDSVTQQEQLRVFCRVCDALNYAHQRGVIHRDIKPSNILVSAHGRADSQTHSRHHGADVKVLDFGLARVTDVDVAAVTVTADTSKLKGTLPYMSPEQVQGDPADIDTRTDVYALGVVLYQLLTGSLPIDPRRRSMTEAISAIRDEQPPRPSTINRALDADIETIILKAIEKDRDRRYQSAAALSEDIHRFLTRQPILARPPSAIYQFRKLVARHRLAFGAGLAVLLVSIGAAIISTSLYIKAQSAQQEAHEQQAIAESINAFLVKTFSSTDPRQAQGRDNSLLRELVDNASRRIDTELSGQPRIQAALDMVVGQVYLSLGMYDEADSHLNRALASRRIQLGPENEKTLQTLNTIAILRADQGRFEEAIRLYTEALEARRRVLGEEHPDTLESMNDLGDLYRDHLQLSKAMPLLKRALELRRKVLGDKHPDTLVSMNNLASAFLFQQRFAKAEKLLRESLAAQLAILPEDHLDVLVSKNDLALALHRQNKTEEANELYRNVYAGFKKQLGEGHLDTLIVGNNLAETLYELGHKSEAIEFFTELATRADQTLPKTHYYSGFVRSVLSRHLLEMGRAEEARSWAEQGLRQLRETLDPKHPYVRNATEFLAEIYEALGMTEESKALKEGNAGPPVERVLP